MTETPDWRGAAEVLRNHAALFDKIADTQPVICGVVCECGPNLEPLACGWARGHDGPHSWSTLPTFPTFPAVTP